MGLVLSPTLSWHPHVDFRGDLFHQASACALVKVFLLLLFFRFRHIVLSSSFRPTPRKANAGQFGWNRSGLLTNILFCVVLCRSVCRPPDTSAAPPSAAPLCRTAQNFALFFSLSRHNFFHTHNSTENFVTHTRRVRVQASSTEPAKSRSTSWDAGVSPSAPSRKLLQLHMTGSLATVISRPAALSDAKCEVHGGTSLWPTDSRKDDVSGDQRPPNSPATTNLALPRGPTSS